MICPNCAKNTPEGKFCEHCGARLPDAMESPVRPVYTQVPAGAPLPNPPFPQPVAQQVSGTENHKNKWIAGILSLIFTGLGQVYNGEFGKGVGYLFGGFFLTLFLLIAELPSQLSFIIVIISLIEAYITADKMNTGTLPYKDFRVSEIVIFIILWAIIFAINTSLLSSGSRSGMGSSFNWL